MNLTHRGWNIFHLNTHKSMPILDSAMELPTALVVNWFMCSISSNTLSNAFLNGIKLGIIHPFISCKGNHLFGVVVVAILHFLENVRDELILIVPKLLKILAWVIQ